MTSTLNYNIRWIEQTFRSRPLVESLLSPEHEAGNITTSDYERAIHFLPGFHRHYRVLGGMIAIPIVYALRRPGWSTIKTYAALSAGALTGFAAGHTVSVTQHYNFVRALDNPAGFSRALENIQRRSGGIMPLGPVIIRQCRRDTQEDLDDRDASESVGTAAMGYSSNESSGPPSKWEQIRAINARMTPASSWEAIRQSHEKERLSKPKTSANVDEDRPGARRSARATQQAEFDVMLEQERRMSSNDSIET